MGKLGGWKCTVCRCCLCWCTGGGVRAVWSMSCMLGVEGCKLVRCSMLSTFSIVLIAYLRCAVFGLIVTGLFGLFFVQIFDSFNFVIPLKFSIMLSAWCSIIPWYRWSPANFGSPSLFFEFFCSAPLFLNYCLPSLSYFQSIFDSKCPLSLISILIRRWHLFVFSCRKLPNKQWRPLLVRFCNMDLFSCGQPIQTHSS